MKRKVAILVAIFVFIGVFAGVQPGKVYAKPADPDPEVITGPITLEANNKVPNGGFENNSGTNISNWDWTSDTVEIITDDVIEGSKSVRVSPNSNWQGCAGASFTVPSIGSGQLYKFTVSFKIENPSSIKEAYSDQLQVGYLGTPALVVINTQTYGSYGENWVRVTKYLDAEELSAGTKNFQLHGNAGSGTPFSILVDAIGLFVVDESSIISDDVEIDSPYDKDYSGAGNISISVDTAQSHQTMEGFGFFGYMGNMGNGKLYTDDWCDKVLNDLGLSMVRLEMAPDSLDSGSNLPKLIEYAKAMKDKALERELDLKVILTVWSPPAKFKTNNSTINGGKLKTDSYEAYAEWCVDVLDEYKKNGVDIYAFSLQNELNFVEPYNSCVYTPAEFVNLLKIAVPIIKSSYPDIKIFGAENMLGFEGNSAHWHEQVYHSKIKADAEALKNIDAFAYHGYVDGIAAENISKHKSLWEYTS